MLVIHIWMLVMHIPMLAIPIEWKESQIIEAVSLLKAGGDGLPQEKGVLIHREPQPIYNNRKRIFR
jgi:hypothetical protein